MRTVVFAGPLLLCVLCVPTGCATDDGAATSQSPAQQAALKARDFYPLAVGNTWTYRSTPGDETRTIAIVREEEGFFIDNNTPPARLQTRSTGVYDGDRFLLEEPLEVGHKWLAVPSASEVERYEIVATGLELSTPAGFFKDCVRVRAETPQRGPDGKPVTVVVLWTYAPQVGLIRIEQRLEMEGANTRSLMTIELIDYELSTSKEAAAAGHRGQGSARP
jgi:hypothetical protein